MAWLSNATTAESFLQAVVEHNLTRSQRVFFEKYYTHFVAYGVLAGSFCLAEFFLSAICFTAILTYPPLKRKFNYLIANMVVINLLLSSTVYPLNIYGNLRALYGELPARFCDWTVYSFFIINAGIWHECVIAIDRYLAIVHSTHYPFIRGKKGVAFTIIAGYVPAVLLNLYPLVAANDEFIAAPPFGDCVLNPRKPEISQFVEIRAILGLYLPSVLTGLSYAAIFAFFMTRRFRVGVAQPSPASDQAVQANVKQARRMRVALLLFLIFLWSLMGNLPLPLIDAFYRDLFRQYPPAYFFPRYATQFSIVGSKVIYAMLNPDYRAGVRAVWLCRFGQDGLRGRRRRNNRVQLPRPAAGTAPVAPINLGARCEA
ncbi:hypothetical protein BV898_03038 [Hypsibius exemplaris]|uniref:G-protein coupled receptors family 1 profile domain-containing protein n=1 Tax=Hypsibius exemplaris TaxID=2072580 RepID=A0A1W0X5W4_HYPEX|nr:hypothetical protein BV898_03038 [Hypsibius exemplaris]